jgi:hypothetical protein
MTSRSASLLAALVLCLAALTPGAAQQEPPAVTFQVEVNYVDVDAVVTDENGRFVGDLKAEDFEILEDGKPQKIAMFSSVELPSEPADRFGLLDRPITSDTRSNRRSFDGRVHAVPTIRHQPAAHRARQEVGARVRAAPSAPTISPP